MILGFTGTRAGMTPPQLATLLEVLRMLRPGEFHHSCCIGADSEAASLCGLIWMVGHPPADTKLMADTKDSERREPKTHFARNRNIVDESEVLLVCPREMSHQDRGGTWYTHDYAVKVGKRTIIIWPDGRVEDSRPSV
jgi:hypothetical protein